MSGSTGVNSFNRNYVRRNYGLETAGPERPAEWPSPAAIVTQLVEFSAALTSIGIPETGFTDSN